MITLRTGDKVPEGMLEAVMASLRIIKQDHLILFVELVRACQRDGYSLDRGYSDLLRARGLMSGDHVDENVRKIVRAAVEGFDATARIVSPTKG